nr:guanine nucleotide-binding protein G(I)/G(S)/G(O) subunit gamma-12 isoform X3 [Kogia breviceps]
MRRSRLRHSFHHLKPGNGGPHRVLLTLGSWSCCLPPGIPVSSAASWVVLPIPAFHSQPRFMVRSTATPVILQFNSQEVPPLRRNCQCPHVIHHTSLDSSLASPLPSSGPVLSCSAPTIPFLLARLACLPFLLRTPHAAHPFSAWKSFSFCRAR